MKVESEAKIEKEKNHYLKSEKEDLESTRISSEYKVSVLSPTLLNILLRLKCIVSTILSKGLNTFYKVLPKKGAAYTLDIMHSCCQHMRFS